jgi:radical SAM superfamily enzyme YgiQ (UPF0313 family)
MAAPILLINTNICPFARVYPIGLDYLASVLIDHEYSVDTLDLAFVDVSGWRKAVSEKLKNTRYLVIGVGIRNLYDELYGGRNYLPDIIAFLRDIKSQTHTPVVVGGSGFSLMPQTILDKSGADYGVTNEGEQAFLQLVETLSSGATPKHSLSSGAFDFSTIRYTRGVWGNFHGYLHDGASGNLQTKRGCPMACLYCEYPAIEGKIFRLRDPNLVAEEFLQLERLGFPRIYFVDATFNNPPVHAKNVLKALKKAKTHVPWTGFFNPKLLDKELLQLAKQTGGAIPLKLTIESGSDLMLKTLRKNFRKEDVARAVELCEKLDIDFSFTVLFGGPGENKETVAETCELIKQCNPVSVSMNIGIYLYPMTPIALKTKGALWHKETDFINPIIYPCDRASILEWIHLFLSGSGIEYRVYGGGEN